MGIIYIGLRRVSLALILELIIQILIIKLNTLNLILNVQKFLTLLIEIENNAR